MTILVVEDDLSLADVVAFTLRRAGYRVAVVHDGLAAVEALEREDPALVLLDLNLPRLDGFTVARRIRQQGDTPIIILSVRDSDEDVVAGLELGADDYVTKPFSPAQLVARVKAVLRRAGTIASGGELHAAGLRLDINRQEVQRDDDEIIRLTGLETRLLELLMSNPGRVLPADVLISRLWGSDGGDRAMLKQLVYRLRNKIEPDPSQPVYVQTVMGVGYILGEANAFGS